MRRRTVATRIKYKRRLGDYLLEHPRVDCGEGEDGTTLLKVVLHISPDEQRERLLARFDNPHEHWKVDPAHVDERAHWHACQTAYEAVLERCSTPAAPWHVVPADRKWYRNWALSCLLLETLEGLDLRWPRPQLDLDGMRAALHAS